MSDGPDSMAGFGLLGKIFKLWVFWAVFVLVANIAIIGGIGYAIYWGLTIAERAVEHEVPTAP